MVMAAGHGTRMRPLTNDRSKAMVEVGGKPLIDHMLDRLADVGVERAIVNVHAHADHFEAHLKARMQGPEIIISDERDQLLETGGGVVKALPLLGTDPIFICNIDAIWLKYACHKPVSPADLGMGKSTIPFPSVKQKPVLEQLIDMWNPAEMDDLLLLANLDQMLGYYGQGDFEVGFDGHLTRRSGQRKPYVYAGVQIARLEPFTGLKIEPFSRNKVWDVSLKNSRIFGHHSAHFFWMHVGDPQALEEAETKLRLGLNE